MNTSLPLVIHCSTDQVFCWYGKNETIIPYSDLERTLPGVLHGLIEKYTPSSLVVINGPGGFTALRIGTLCVKLSSDHYGLPVYSWTKIALYTMRVDQGILPTLGYVGIGQRKNIWLYDFEKQNHIMVHANEEYSFDGVYFIDMMQNHAVVEYVNRSSMVTLSGTEDGLCCSYTDKQGCIERKTLEDDTHKTDHITPEYMIEPTLS